MGLGDHIATNLNVTDIEHLDNYFVFYTERYLEGAIRRFQTRAAFTYDDHKSEIPEFLSTDYTTSYAFMDMHMFAFMSDTTMDGIQYSKLMVRVDDPDDHNVIDSIADKLQQVVGRKATVRKKYN